MDAYIYKAALYCEGCALHLRRTLPDESIINNSETWPQGPYANGGGEADTPQHCDTCDVFLENPLTSDGLNYVREHVEAEQTQNTRTGYEAQTRVGEWRTFYEDALIS